MKLITPDRFNSLLLYFGHDIRMKATGSTGLPIFEIYKSCALLSSRRVLFYIRTQVIKGRIEELSDANLIYFLLFNERDA